MLYDLMGRPGGKGDRALYIMLLRTSKAFLKEESLPQAYCVVDYGRAQLPDFFKDGYKAGRGPGSVLSPARRHPTAAEIPRGVPVDKDGYFAQDKGPYGVKSS